jgi:hypothetical protein
MSTENTTIALLRKEQATLEAIIRINVPQKEDAAAIAIQELEFLSMHMIAKPFIAECIQETVIHAVKYSLKNNLSLDPNAGLVYLTPTSVQTGKDANGKGIYKTALEIKPTADGKLSIAYQCGTILDHERPKVKKGGHGEVVSVSVRVLLPSVPSPRWEEVEMDQSDFDRLRKFSHAKNGRGKNDADPKNLNYANPLYTSFNGGIDPEFARSKVVSAALKKRGTNMASRLSERIVTTTVKEVMEEKQPESFTEYAEVVESKTNEPVTDNNGIVDGKVQMPNAEDL